MFELIRAVNARTIGQHVNGEAASVPAESCSRDVCDAMSCAKDRSSGSILMSQAKLFLTSSLWPLPQLQDTSDLTECKACSQWSLRLYCVRNHLGVC